MSPTLLPYPHPYPDLLSLYIKAGVKNLPTVFLLTDAQIVRESFLIYINDLLATGQVADLASPEDRDNFCNSVGMGGFPSLLMSLLSSLGSPRPGLD